MSRLLVLPGNSPRNAAWGGACANYFADWFTEVTVQQYVHWTAGTATIDFPTEVEQIRRLVVSDPTDRWCIFAKSAGSLLALRAVAANAIAPEQCVFFGMPLDVTAATLYHDDQSSFEQFIVPTLAFHNDHDPVADLSAVQDKLTQKQNIELIVCADTTHEYLEFEHYVERIDGFLRVG